MSDGYKDLWEVEALRLTAFPTNNSQYVFNNDWWSTIVGSEPESVTNTPKNASFDLKGKINGLDKAQLVLHADPARIDWALLGIQNQPLELPFAGNFQDLIDVFSKLVNNWIEKFCPPISRIAFGSILYIQTESKLDSYNKLNELLQWVDIDVENSRELIYRINRPKDSSINIPNKEINRISNWGAITFKTMVFKPDGTSSGIGTRDAVRLELDISTSAENNDELKSNLLTKIFNELVGYGLEIADNGDIK